MWQPSKNDYTFLDRLVCLVLIAVLAIGAVSLFLPQIAEGQSYQGPTPRQRKAQLEQLDLPVNPPSLGAQLDGYYWKEGPPPPDDGDDPRDTPPPVFYGEEIDLEGDALVYVVDRSGSMRLDERLEKAKRELSRSVEGLADNMRFEMYKFSTLVYPCFGGNLMPADDGNKAVAQGWIKGLVASGGTLTGEAMSVALLAHRDCLNYVLLSDGAPSTGTQKAQDMIKDNNRQGAVIDTFGIAAYGAFRAFLQAVARESGGSYVDVP